MFKFYLILLISFRIYISSRFEYFLPMDCCWGCGCLLYRCLIKHYFALDILKTGPIRKNTRLRTLRNSGFIPKHIISHSNV